MRDLLIWLALGLLVLAALAIPIWLPRYRRWLDARKFYRADPFPAVKIEEDSNAKPRMRGVRIVKDWE